MWKDGPTKYYFKVGMYIYVCVIIVFWTQNLSHVATCFLKMSTFAKGVALKKVLKTPFCVNCISLVFRSSQGMIVYFLYIQLGFVAKFQCTARPGCPGVGPVPNNSAALALHELDFFLYFSLENLILSCATVGLQHILQHLKKLPFSYPLTIYTYFQIKHLNML